jgi:hypothetical protein
MTSKRLTDEMIDLLFDELSEEEAAEARQDFDNDAAELAPYEDMLAEIRSIGLAHEVPTALHNSIMEIGRRGIATTEATAPQTPSSALGFWSSLGGRTSVGAQVALVATVLLSGLFVVNMMGETVSQKFGVQRHHQPVAFDFPAPSAPAAAPAPSAETVTPNPEIAIDGSAPSKMAEESEPTDRPTRARRAKKAAREMQAIQDNKVEETQRAAASNQKPRSRSGSTKKLKRSAKKRRRNPKYRGTKGGGVDYGYRSAQSADNNDGLLKGMNMDGTAQLDDLLNDVVAKESAEKESKRATKPKEKAEFQLPPLPEPDEAQAAREVMTDKDFSNAFSGQSKGVSANKSAIAEAAPGSKSVESSDFQKTDLSEEQPNAGKSRVEKLYRGGRYGEVIAESNRLLKGRTSDRADLLTLKAQALIKLERYEEADRILSEIQERYPSYQPNSTQRKRASIQTAKQGRAKAKKTAADAAAEEPAAAEPVETGL